MGFGFMFLGYILLLKTNVELLGVPIDITPDVLGFLLMAHGFSIASKHCGCFRVTELLSKIGIPLSFAVVLLDTMTALKALSLPTSAASVISWLYAVYQIVFTLCFLRSIVRISQETGLPKLQKRAARNMIYTAILFFTEQALPSIVSLFGIEIAETTASAIMLLAGIAYVVLNAALTFSCYMWICLEGDEDMPDTRKHKYKTPFDYYDKGREKNVGTSHKKKKKRK